MVHASFKDPGVINRDMSRDGALAPIGPELPLKLAAITDYRRSELENVVSIRQGAQPPNLSHNRFYWHSEYFSHQRPGYFASVRMHSSRNHNMEAPHNEESLKMHHYADGANFISRNGTEYFDIFPVWDWQKIPGTTVVQKPALPHWNQIVKAGKSDFVGAVSDGLFGAAVFDFESVHDPLRAKKAWFFFEDSYVCLGTDIYSESDFPVVTTLNQTLSRSDALIKTSKGIEVLTDGGKAIKEVMWVHQDSVGYQFHQPTTAQIHNQFKTGYWSNISNNLRAQRRPQVSKKVFSLWVDHGVKPVGDSYAYTVYPGIDAELMERVTASDQVRIIANTDQLQGVWHEGLGIAQLVFYKPGRANLPNGSWVSISTPGMVLVRLEGGEFSEITLSDPSREEKVVTLELGGRFVGNGPYWTASATNARTSVLQIKLPEGDQAGKSALVKNDGWEGQAIDFADLLKESKQRLPVATEGRRYIGEKFGGGVVVWLDETGTHGLIAADADQHMAISWRNGQVSVPQLYGDHGDRYVNAVGDGMYAGADNTLLIIAQQTSDNLSGNFAAKVCAACTDSGYGDWYLPSKEELSILFQSKGLLEGIEGDMYWSSSEYNIGFVWGQNFKGYGGWYPLTKGSRYAVRCVRRF
jgi:chondroitin AC lyase